MTELDILSRISWSPVSASSRLLTARGIAHGFVGRGKPPPVTHYAKQVHGISVIAAGASTAPDTPTRAAGDAVLTTERRQRVAVKTSDCVPLLICDPDHAVAAAVHAGWRGLTAGIIAQAVAALRRAGGQNLTGIVGPTIGRERYEVGKEVIDALRSTSSGLTPIGAALCTSKGRSDKWHADLAPAAALALAAAGLPPEAIEVVQTCTYTDQTLWHSARREGPGFGSNWSWIEL